MAIHINDQIWLHGKEEKKIFFVMFDYNFTWFLPGQVFERNGSNNFIFGYLYAWIDTNIDQMRFPVAYLTCS